MPTPTPVKAGSAYAAEAGSVHAAEAGSAHNTAARLLTPRS